MNEAQRRIQDAQMVKLTRDENGELRLPDGRLLKDVQGPGANRKGGRDADAKRGEREPAD